MSKLIYTDSCTTTNQQLIKKQLNCDIILQINYEDWNISSTTGIITSPEIELAVINKLDERTVTEMGLLSFLCKPILVTTKLVERYPTLYSKIINYVDYSCNLNSDKCNFINWYKEWKIK